MDDALVTWLNALARRRAGLRRLVEFAAARLAGVEVALMLLLAVTGSRRSALNMLLAVGAVYVICDVLGGIWPRARPFERLHAVSSLTPHDPGRSFPSRHIASGLAMAAIGGRDHPRLGVLMAVVAWVLGASRVAAGLHYPTDVLAGALLGRIVGRCLTRPGGRLASRPSAEGLRRSAAQSDRDVRRGVPPIRPAELFRGAGGRRGFGRGRTDWRF